MSVVGMVVVMLITVVVVGDQGEVDAEEQAEDEGLNNAGQQLDRHKKGAEGNAECDLI